MWSGARLRLARYLHELTGAATPGAAAGFILQYLALRCWAGLVCCFPISWNVRTARLIGWLWWHAPLRALRKHRARALEHLRAAFAGEYSEAELERIGRESFAHFASLYLVELVQSPRLITEWTWARYVELEELGPALRELLGTRGVIMLTGHFGSYELLGYTISRLGLPIVAVMRPTDNELLNRFIVNARAASGMELLYKKGATAMMSEVLAAGRPLCFIADQDAGRKGQFVSFFGRPASTYKSIGLLAMNYDAPIIVGAAIRQGRGFRYRLCVERIIQPAEWAGREDKLAWITQEYSAALERLIRRAPEQYLWIHRRWKHQPKPAGTG